MDIQTLESNEELRQAYGLVLFALKALKDTETTEIGKEQIISTEDAVTIGYQHSFREMPIGIVSLKKLPLEKNNKLKNKIDLIEKYATEIGLSEKSKSIAIERISNYETNHTVMLPVPLRTHVKFFYEYQEGFRQKIDGEVFGFEYTLNKETLQFEYRLILRNERSDNKVKFPITQVNTDVFIGNYDNKSQISENQNNLIKFTRFGYVKPIKCTKKGIEYVIDNCFVYGDNKILGKLTKDGIEAEDGVDVAEHVKNLSSLIKKATYIYQYIPYMAPYGLGEVNDLNA